MEDRTNRNRPTSILNIEGSIDHCRGGGVCMDVDGVEDDGTARDEVVDAEIEGTVRFGGLGEFFAPEDLQERKKERSENGNQK